MEGDNVYVYKVDKENTVKKVPVEIGLRKKGIVEIKSGLEDGDTVVAEGLKKQDLMERLNQLNMAQNKKHQVGKKKPSQLKLKQKKVSLIG